MSIEHIEALYRLRRASAFANPRNQAETLPLRWGVYSTNTELKFNGFPLVCIDTVNFKYIPFDGEGTNAGNVRVWDKDGTIIAGGNYTYDVAEVDENGATQATITFTGDQVASEPLTAEVDGRKCTPGYLYNQQSHYYMVAVYDFLVNVCGFTAGDVLNLTSWWRALARCRSYDYYCRIFIDKDMSPAEFLSITCSSFAADWWPDQDNKVKFEIHPTANDYYIDFASSDNHIVQGTLKQKIKLSDVVNQVSVNVGSCAAGFVLSNDGSTTKNTPSQQLFGERTHEANLTYLGGVANWTAQLANVQNALIQRYREPWLLEMQTKDRKFFLLERFNVFAFSCDFLYDSNLTQLRNAAFQILYRQTNPVTGISRILALKLKAVYKYLLWFAGGNPNPATTQGRVLANGSRRAGGDPDPNKY